MIDLEKLNQLDFKNFDADEIPEFLSEHRKIVWLLFLMVTLIIGVLMFYNYSAKEQSLRFFMSQEQGKSDLAQARDAAIKNFNDFQSSLPREINEFQLVNEISADARLYNITLASIIPEPKLDMGLYDTTDVKFNAEADNFKDMMLFLKKIEMSPTPLMINSWAGREGEDGRVTSSLQVGAIHIHP